jgi:hypothetical protein
MRVDLVKRLEALERGNAGPPTQHLVWKSPDETQEEAVARFYADRPTLDPNDNNVTLMILRWQESVDESSLPAERFRSGRCIPARCFSRC